MSMHLTFSGTYPYPIKSFKSSTKVFGLQEIYTISLAPKSHISFIACLCIPGLGGSTIIKSGLTSKLLTVSLTSPAINSQLSKPFNLAFSLAATTASSIISIPVSYTHLTLPTKLEV